MITGLLLFCLPGWEAAAKEYSPVIFQEREAIVSQEDNFPVFVPMFSKAENSQLLVIVNLPEFVWILFAFLIVAGLGIFFLFRSRFKATKEKFNLLEKEFEKKTTELIRAKEKVEAEIKIKSDFLAMMSHEIRTPMNGVIGMADLLAESGLKPDQAELVQTLRVSGENLLDVINDILDFSKLESGKFDLNENGFDLRSVIESVYDIMASRAYLKHLDLIYQLEPEVPSYVLGDEVRLKQILINLVGNAIKFTEKGHIYIYVKAYPGSNGKMGLEFLVRDTGIGISGEKISKLFMPYAQISGQDYSRTGGTGLGLSICSKLAGIMGGRIWVESEEGKGSDFKFSITVKPAASLPKFYLDSRISELKGLKVLIVDDNQTNLEVLTTLTRQWEMEPVSFSDPLLALQEVKNGKTFDLAILDYKMQGMNGLELAKKISATGNGKNTRILILSSMDLAADIRKEGQHLISGILTKPVKQTQFLDALTSIIKGNPHSSVVRIPESKFDSSMGEKVPLQILIAEDNSVNLDLMMRVLSLLGYTADGVSDGYEAVCAAIGKPYQLIFMDVQMPVMDGFEATREISRLLPENLRPAIIAMTANAMPGDKEKCLETGMNDYLSKPVVIEDLKTILRKWGTKKEVQNLNHSPSSTENNNEIDFSRLREISGGDEFFIKSLLEKISLQIPELLEKIDSSFIAEDFQGLRLSAHKLKSTISYLNNNDFRDTLQEIENRSAKGINDSVLVALVKKARASGESVLSKLKVFST